MNYVVRSVEGPFYLAVWEEGATLFSPIKGDALIFSETNAVAIAKQFSIEIGEPYNAEVA